MNAAERKEAPVAVITTLYRSDPLDFFEIAIASIENQITTHTVRIYLCIDGELPQSKKIWLESNRHRFYKIVQNNVNIGLAKSLNRLIDNLEDEEFVFRMDGDDISLPTRFAKQLELMAADPECGLAGCQADDIDNDGHITGHRVYPTEADRVRALLGRITPVLHPSFCVRRRVYAELGLRYPDAHLCEDLAFLVLCARAGVKISNHPDTLFQWRSGPDFFVRRRSAKRGFHEMKWYLIALRDSGRLLSRDIVYPPMRFVLRCLPAGMVRKLYGAGVRERSLNMTPPKSSCTG